MRPDINKMFKEKCPCDKCHQKYKCEEQELACRAFSYFVMMGTFHPETPRHPTHGLFNKIFKEDDKELKHYLKKKGEQQNELF